MSNNKLSSFYIDKNENGKKNFFRDIHDNYLRFFSSMEYEEENSLNFSRNF